MKIGLLALLLLLFPFFAGAAYYADISVDVGSDGISTLSGTTNHPALAAGQSSEFTSKEGKYWLFSIDLNEQFSDFVFSVLLPEGASINYAKGPSVRIETENGRIAVKGVGSNGPFSLKIQYSLEADQKEPLIPLWGYVLLLFALFIAASYLILRYKKKNSEPIEKPRKKGLSEKEKASLTERQLAIIGIVEKNKGFVSQKKVEEELGIPKSSVSRNVEALVKRGYLKKEEKGMTNMLFLVETK
ncbi:MAG: MarR family transcriptional regulator [Candidatus Diapherotrites archaeon]|nr:MarR family transcriptional regulator [Candidatus Diapherotrites archaeon]